MNTEFPKMLYLGGTCTDEQALAIDPQGVPLNARIANDADEEATHRSDGYLPIGEGAAEPTEFERLKALAKERDIKVNGSWGIKKLREVLGMEG